MEGRQLMQMRIETIRVDGRYRKDMGNISALAGSIAGPAGLINPITVTTDGRLVAGERRLAACRLLGWETVPAIVVDGLDDAVAHLIAERDENTERKEMTISELVALGRALEELEKPRAADRMLSGRKQEPSDHVNIGSEGSVRDIVGAAIGLPSTSYQKARKVVEAAADLDATPAERSAARAALAEMDATGHITPAYEKVRGLRASSLKAPVKAGIAGAAPQRKAVTAALANLSGISYGLSQITELHPGITSEEAAQWVDGLSEARRVLETLIKRCKERTNA
jgi:ParB family chromosome partitioning protein